MYVSDRHPDRDRLLAAQAAPEPSGQLVATFPRPGSKFGPPSELRLSIDEYLGNRYAQLLVWAERPDGVMAPTSKRLTVKCRELEDLGKALIKAAKLVEAEQGGPPPARRPQRGSAAAPRRDRPEARGQGSLLPREGSSEVEPAAWDQEFDEFGR